MEVSSEVISLESFQAAAALVTGLFFYDAFFVFKSDVMVTVATQIEAPAKLLLAAVRDAGDTRHQNFLHFFLVHVEKKTIDAQGLKHRRLN